MKKKMAEFVEWAQELLGQPDLSLEEMEDGFAILQVMSLLDSNSVFLEWYSSDEAFECLDIHKKVWKDIEDALLKFNLTMPSEECAQEVKSYEIMKSLFEKQTNPNGSNKKHADITKDDHDYLQQNAGLIKKPQNNIEQDEAKNSQTNPNLYDERDHEESKKQLQEQKNHHQKELLSKDSFMDDLESTQYMISEPAFKSHVRWVLTMIKYKAKNILCKKVVSQIKELQSKIIEQEDLIPYLCSGQIYELACALIDDRQEKISRIRDLLETTQDFQFLDTLTSKGLLDINSKMKHSIKELITDANPFYESIHFNIMNALTNGYLLKAPATQLEKQIQRLNINPSSLSTSNDISSNDSFSEVELIQNWVNAILKTKLKNRQPIKNLVYDLADYKVINNVINYYHPPEDVSFIKETPSRQILKEVVGKCQKYKLMVPYWLSQEVLEKSAKKRNHENEVDVKVSTSFENLFLIYFFHLFEELSKAVSESSAKLSSVENKINVEEETEKEMIEEIKMEIVQDNNTSTQVKKVKVSKMKLQEKAHQIVDDKFNTENSKKEIAKIPEVEYNNHTISDLHPQIPEEGAAYGAAINDLLPLLLSEVKHPQEENKIEIGLPQLIKQNDNSTAECTSKSIPNLTLLVKQQKKQQTPTNTSELLPSSLLSTISSNNKKTLKNSVSEQNLAENGKTVPLVYTSLQQKVIARLGQQNSSNQQQIGKKSLPSSSSSLNLHRNPSTPISLHGLRSSSLKNSLSDLRRSSINSSTAKLPPLLTPMTSLAALVNEEPKIQAEQLSLIEKEEFQVTIEQVVDLKEFPRDDGKCIIVEKDSKTSITLKEECVVADIEKENQQSIKENVVEHCGNMQEEIKIVPYKQEKHVEKTEMLVEDKTTGSKENSSNNEVSKVKIVVIKEIPLENEVKSAKTYEGKMDSTTKKVFGRQKKQKQSESKSNDDIGKKINYGKEGLIKKVELKNNDEVLSSELQNNQPINTKGNIDFEDVHSKIDLVEESIKLHSESKFMEIEETQEDVVFNDNDQKQVKEDFVKSHKEKSYVALPSKPISEMKKCQSVEDAVIIKVHEDYVQTKIRQLNRDVIFDKELNVINNENNDEKTKKISDNSENLKDEFVVVDTNEGKKVHEKSFRKEIQEDSRKLLYDLDNQLSTSEQSKTPTLTIHKTKKQDETLIQNETIKGALTSDEKKRLPSSISVESKIMNKPSVKLETMFEEDSEFWTAEDELTFLESKQLWRDLIGDEMASEVVTLNLTNLNPDSLINNETSNGLEVNTINSETNEKIQQHHEGEEELLMQVNESIIQSLAPAAEPHSLQQMEKILKEEEIEENQRKSNRLSSSAKSQEKIGFIHIPLYGESESKEKPRRQETIARKKSSKIQERLDKVKEMKRKKEEEKEFRRREQEEKHKKAIQQQQKTKSGPKNSANLPTKLTTTGSPIQLPSIKSQSNRTLIKNALQHVCLAGPINDPVKEDVMKDLESSSFTNFIILFKGQKNHLFRGLYSYDAELNQVLKIYSGTQGPDVLGVSDVVEFYKYDSGSRSFKALPTHGFSRNVHAVAIGIEAVRYLRKQQTSSLVK